MSKKAITIIITLVIINLTLAWQVLGAGTLDSPGTPGATNSYTLADIYNRLDTGAAGLQSTFTEPTSGPTSGTMHTLDEIMGKAPTVDDANGATAADTLVGKTYFGLTSGAWGLGTGTMADNGAVNLMPNTVTQTIVAGYHNGAGTMIGDTDLISANILNGVTIFGVTGTVAGGGNVFNGGVGKTGQTTCFDSAGTGRPCAGTGEDGELQRGVGATPRFTDNVDGTVTDNVTGLIWLKEANCPNASRNWQTALADVVQLNTNGTMNGNNCGDTSNGGGHQTDWRLPNIKELESLVDFSQTNPALPSGQPFANVQPASYWASTTFVGTPANGWVVSLSNGTVNSQGKTSFLRVWAVRGGS